MPAKSEKQAKFMRAVAHGWKPAGKDVPSEKVAKKFMHVDHQEVVTEKQGKFDFRDRVVGKSTPSTVKKGQPKPKSEKEVKAEKKKFFVKEKPQKPTHKQELLPGLSSDPKAKEFAEIEAATAKAREREKKSSKVEITAAKKETKKTKKKARAKAGAVAQTRGKLKTIGKDVKATQVTGKKLEVAAKDIESKRSSTRKKGEELEQEKTKTAKRAPGLQVDSIQPTGRIRLFDKKELEKEVGEKEISAEDMYRKGGISHTPEEEREGLPAIKKNEKWFKAMLKTHLGSNNKNKP